MASITISKLLAAIYAKTEQQDTPVYIHDSYGKLIPIESVEYHNGAFEITIDTNGM